MAAWCAENLRDLEGWRSSGLALSTASNECAKLFDGALRQLVSWSDCDALGSLLKTLENMTTADPQAVLPRAFSLGLEALGTNTCTRVNKALKNSLEQLQKDAKEYGNEREQKHAKAVILYADGHIRAATNIWEEILAEYPTDMMALKFAQDGYFFIGDINGKRNSVQAVLPKYKGTEPCYSYLYGMQAFGLEECQQYDEAEKSALKALNLNRFDCWATHARAHCMIMQGRISQGIDMMESTVDDWKRGWIIATHNYWHKALFYLEKGDFETSLTIFDDEICRRFNSSKNVLDLADCASLLWRLEMEGVDVGKRWHDLSNMSTHKNDHVTCFNDMHLGFTFMRQEDAENESDLYSTLLDFANHSDEDNTKVCRDVGVPLYEGIRHFAKGQYDMAVEKMLPY
ncbi:tetratricopeptide repeat protein [Oesophagostomum dentatum]|uniref:Tetratricopeptide repeat protein 38 n=1 Tax=Oesophagostomum dentatum TaxID=61180 RepID=A0A0B1SZL9_OESDE|nr:tetratricopeptide repeat protein [Oesophagostomum dentatum]